MMAPRGFDRYMVVVGAGRNRKFARLTDSERCAHFLGVLSVAAQSPRRGYLLISEQEEAGPEEIATEAGVSVKVAKNTMAKLMRVGVLERDEEVGAWFVHDWDDVNPSPGAERTKRWRDAQTSPDRHTSVTKDVSNGHGSVTETSQKASRERHANITEPSPEVKKLEVKKLKPSSETSSPKNARRRAPRQLVDQNVLPPMTGELHHAAHVSLGILRDVWALRGGLEPTLRGVGLAVAAFPDRDHVDVARRVEHWLIAGNGREADCGDIVQRFRRFLKGTAATKPGQPAPAAENGTVVPLSRRERLVNDRNRFIDH